MKIHIYILRKRSCRVVFCQVSFNSDQKHLVKWTEEGVERVSLVEYRCLCVKC